MMEHTLEPDYGWPDLDPTSGGNYPHQPTLRRVRQRNMGGGWDGYAVSCSCGWRSANVEDKSQAWELWSGHRDLVEEGGDGE